MILHAAARVLGCGSVQMSVADHERQALVFTTSIQNRELQRVRQVESVLGFQLEGAAMPFAIESSLLVRALRHERLIVTNDIAELAGGARSMSIAGADSHGDRAAHVRGGAVRRALGDPRRALVREAGRAGFSGRGS